MNPDEDVSETELAETVTAIEPEASTKPEEEVVEALKKTVPEAPVMPKKVDEGAPPAPTFDEGYEQTDIFEWANNMVQHKDKFKIELFLFNKRYVMYRAKLAQQLAFELQPLFVDEILNYVLEGADKGLLVRGFEEGESEENVLQRVPVARVEKAKEVLNWLKHQESEIEQFVEAEHDLKQIKGVLARCRLPDGKGSFYVIKVLPQSQVLKGETAWMVQGDKFTSFEADAGLRIPPDNQLLIVGQDMFVFNQAKLTQLFGYNAKKHSIAEQKVAEIQQKFKLTFDEAMSLQAAIQSNKALVNKLQNLNIEGINQQELIDHAEELGLSLMVDDSGAIIIMDEKDLKTFVNLLNDDYVESNLTGQRWEIQRKKPLKIDEDAELLKEVTS